jgi:hypothetical protein
MAMQRQRIVYGAKTNAPNTPGMKEGCSQHSAKGRYCLENEDLFDLRRLSIFLEGTSVQNTLHKKAIYSLYETKPNTPHVVIKDSFERETHTLVNALFVLFGLEMTLLVTKVVLVDCSYLRTVDSNYQRKTKENGHKNKRESSRVTNRSPDPKILEKQQ